MNFVFSAAYFCDNNLSIVTLFSFGLCVAFNCVVVYKNHSESEYSDFFGHTQNWYSCVVSKTCTAIHLFIFVLSLTSQSQIRQVSRRFSGVVKCKNKRFLGFTGSSVDSWVL